MDAGRPGVAGWTADQRAHALRQWREGERAARGVTAPDWARDYAAVIATVLATLRRYETMDDLLRGYFRERDHHWLHRVCELADGRVLSKSVVEDAAFWRRLQQLLARPGEDA